MLGEWSRISEVVVVISETTEKGGSKGGTEKSFEQGFLLFLCVRMHFAESRVSCVLLRSTCLIDVPNYFCGLVPS